MFVWSDYLTLATRLATDTAEASQRSAVSRAYYAAFCTARAVLRTRKVPIPDWGEAHTLVWQTFADDPDPKMQRIGIQGKRLKRSRRCADYDDVVSNLPAVVADALLKANDILNLLHTS